MKRLFASIFLLFTVCVVGATFVYASDTPTTLVNHKITSSVEFGQGTITPFGTSDVPEGDNITFIFSAANCWEIDEILVDGDPVLETGPGFYTFVNVAEDHTIAVSFKEITYTVTASAGPGGTITPAGDIPVACNGALTFTFTPNAGYEIDQITKDGATQPIVNPFILSPITDDHIINVTFKLIPVDSFTITASFEQIYIPENAGTGEIYGIVNEASIKVASGENATFTFNLYPGAEHPGQIESITKDGVPVPQTGFTPKQTSYSYDNVTADGAIHVVFEWDGTGINEISIPELALVPNPTDGKTTINNGGVDFTKIEVMNNVGNVVLTINNPSNSLDLSSLSTGNYFVRFYTEKGYATRRIIKQ